MNIGLHFEKWWASTNNATYFSPNSPSAYILKQATLEAFAAGYLLNRNQEMILRERIQDEVRGIMPPMLVDEKGFVKLSNVDVERIAKATVDHMYEIKALAATQRLQEQNRQAREYRDAVALVRPPFAVVEALKKAASDRVDVALRESENTIANILKIHGYGAYDHVIKFEFVISALKNLVAAIKILKERI